jgi:hypothetical protein
MLKIHDGKIKVRTVCPAGIGIAIQGIVMTPGHLVTISAGGTMPQFGDPKLRKEDEPIERGDVHHQQCL